tara:strand:+ start:3393 stop:5438 length:2046 start_codon:yes stop_codon:yes gene_type:complete
MNLFNYNAKKIFKFFVFFVLAFFIYIFYELSSLNYKIVNRNFFSISLDNIRNPQVKKMMRGLDRIYSSLLLLSDKNKSYFDNQDLRDNLPNEKIIKKTNDYSENLFPKNNNGKDWQRNYGNSASNRFSSLKLINKTNLNKLDLFWKYEIPGDSVRDIQSNVIVAEEKIFIPSSNKKIIALNALNGKFLWEFKLKNTSPRRGMVFLKENNNSSRLLFSSYNQLISLNASDGKPTKKFGNNGKIKLKRASITSPAIYKDKIIITTSEPAVEIYDLNKGNLLWKFILMKKITNRYGGKRYDHSGGNPWGGFSLDKERGIVFITTGNAGRYFNGVNRPGKNNYANSIIAIDLKKRKKLWDFQEVRHDIWNLDIPAPPILGSITIEGRKVDVVIAVTKLGNTIVLDRITGKPIFDFHLRKAPKSKIPGEKTNFYQPAVKIPEPFSKNIFSLNEVTNINDESREYILDKIKDSKFGFFEPYELGRKNIQFNFHGGAEWAGASFDLKKEKLYVSSSNIAWETAVKQIKKKNKFSPPAYYKYNSEFKRLLDQNGYPGSKPPWGTITSIDLKTGKILWQIPFGEYKELSQAGVPLTGTENYSGVTGTESGLLLATGTLDKKFKIYDTSNGQELWSYSLPFIGSSPPITYQIGKEQFILINSTGSFSLKKGYPELVEFGNLIMVFKLKNEN